MCTQIIDIVFTWSFWTKNKTLLMWWLSEGHLYQVQILQFQVKSYQRHKKWYLMLPCSTHSIIRYGSRVKWSNPEIILVFSSTPRCSSSWKVSLWVALDYGQLIYINNWPIGIVGRVFANGSRDWGSIPDWVILKTQKMVLNATCLTLSILRYGSRLNGAIQRK